MESGKFVRSCQNVAHWNCERKSGCRCVWGWLILKCDFYCMIVRCYFHSHSILSLSEWMSMFSIFDTSLFINITKFCNWDSISSIPFSFDIHRFWHFCWNGKHTSNQFEISYVHLIYFTWSNIVLRSLCTTLEISLFILLKMWSILLMKHFQFKQKII